MAAVTAAVAMMVGLTTGPDAQGLGTFRWQQRPFCNLVTLSVGCCSEQGPECLDAGGLS
jgi:hypothetical protein